MFLSPVIPSHHPVLSTILSKEIRFSFQFYRLMILASSFGHLCLRWSAIHLASVTLLHHVISLSGSTPLAPGSSEPLHRPLGHCQLETPHHALIPLHIKISYDIPSDTFSSVPTVQRHHIVHEAPTTQKYDNLPIVPVTLKYSIIPLIFTLQSHHDLFLAGAN